MYLQKPLYHPFPPKCIVWLPRNPPERRQVARHRIPLALQAAFFTRKPTSFFDAHAKFEAAKRYIHNSRLFFNCAYWWRGLHLLRNSGAISTAEKGTHCFSKPIDGRRRLAAFCKPPLMHRYSWQLKLKNSTFVSASIRRDRTRMGIQSRYVCAAHSH